ncbi:MAG: hypothetical protein ACRDNK_08325 [Solirubrobacteraceae bacterium]
MTRRSTLFGLALALTAVLAASAVAATVSSQGVAAAGLKAVFSYVGQTPNVHGGHLKITQGSHVLYSRPVTAKLCGHRCGPAAVGHNAKSIGIAALQPLRPANVILELFSGGANCCFIDQVFSYDPSHKTFVKTEHYFGNAGALIKPIGPHHRFEFRSANPAFQFVFTDGADSGEPLQIWQFADRAFADVTRSYPGLIRKDAARWFKFFKRDLSNGVGLIAAWAADEELLGQDAFVQSVLATQANQGHLRAGNGGGNVSGHAFIAKLNRFLVKQGYKP